MSFYSVSPEAQKDLFEIWVRIARDSVDLANRIEAEFYSRFESLGQTPGQGHTRKDLTKRSVLFYPLYSFLIIYQPEPLPIKVLAILRGRRNVKRILKQRP